MTVQDIFAHKANEVVVVAPAQCSLGDAKDEVVNHASFRIRTKINFEFISIKRIVPFIKQLNGKLTKYLNCLVVCDIRQIC